jgi:hypothetical protein
MIWHFLCSQLNGGRTEQVAVNGSHVLRTMFSAVRDTSEGRARAAHGLSMHAKRELRLELERRMAWLPAYDRRDVIAIKTALDAIVHRLFVQQHVRRRRRSVGAAVVGAAKRSVTRARRAATRCKRPAADEPSPPSASTSDQRAGGRVWRTLMFMWRGRSAADAATHTRTNDVMVQLEAAHEPPEPPEPVFLSEPECEQPRAAAATADAQADAASAPPAASASSPAASKGFERARPSHTISIGGAHSTLPALTLAAYHAAILNRDATAPSDGESPRAWLASAGILLDETQLTSATWLDASSPVQRTPAADADDDGAADSSDAASAREAEVSTLSAAQLELVGWRLLRGASRFALTPAGEFWVPSRRGAHAKWHWDLRSEGELPKLRSGVVGQRWVEFLALFSVWGFALSNFVRGWATVLKASDFTDHGRWRTYVLSRLWLSYVFLVAWLVCFLGWQWWRFLSFVRNGRLPPPLLYAPGKLEYALFLTAGSIAAARLTYTSDFGYEQASMGLFSILMIVFSVGDVALALAGAGASALAERDARFLFATWSRRLERRHSVVY